MKRKILITTTTRADWGILSPLAKALASRPDVEVSILASNMHLDPSRGNTLGEIRADGFEPIIAPMPTGYESAADAARAMCAGAAEAATVMERVCPDVTVMLGDRFEMLAMASVAAVMRIPIIHLCGGEISEGAIDDCFRHSITKLAALHLVTTESHRRRVIQLGEEPERVINVGSPAAANAALPPEMSRAELEADLGWKFGEGALLVTIHPETMGDIPARELARRTLTALDHFPQSQVLITYPNNDPDGEQIIDEIKAYASRNPHRVKVVPSLGRRRYMAALRCVAAVVGNSSSGLTEVPAAGVPTVDIGNRQARRDRGESVIHAEATETAIAEAIVRALAMDRATITTPYLRHDTLGLMTRAVAETPLELLRRPKRFHDINLTDSDRQ